MRYNEIIESIGGYSVGAMKPDPFSAIIDQSGYLYHGTAKVRLGDIARYGLIPSEKSRFSRDPFIGDWSLGKVFFATKLGKAIFYAREASKSQPLVLRIPASAISDAIEDPRDTNSVYVDHPVPASVIERWNGKKWVGI